MKDSKTPVELVDIIATISNKRAKIVIEHIIKNGFITTEEIKNYGYEHAPRAARDVREAGVPLVTYRVKSGDNRSIAAYKFGDLSQIDKGKLGGRLIFPKWLKDQLFEESSGKCHACNNEFESRYLQIDHRVPYEVGGDQSGVEFDPKDFMLLCGSCNRAKSWSCEQCENWKKDKSIEVCQNCYWGNPIDYKHIALKQVRRVDIQWEGDEVATFDKLKALAVAQKSTLQYTIKEIVKNTVIKKN